MLFRSAISTDELCVNDIASALDMTKSAVSHQLRLLKEIGRASCRERVNGLMAADYCDCDVDRLSVTLEFKVLPWELNRGGFLHGGIICAMLDHTAGAAASSYTGIWCPTVDMDVRFLSFGKPGDSLLCTGRIVAPGRRILHMEAILQDKATGKVVASSTSTYLNSTDRQEP